MPNQHQIVHCPTMLLLIAFFLLLAQISTSLTSAEGIKEGGIRAKRHPPMKSRQRAAADGECILGYKQRIEHHCRYPSTEQPCFHQADSEAAVEEAAKKCCQSGLLCSTNDFEGLCCRTMECLQKCYGSTFFQRFRDRGFKYLDILLRPPTTKEEEEQKNAANLENLVDKVEEELAVIELNKLEKEMETLAQKITDKLAAKSVD